MRKLGQAWKLQNARSYLKLFAVMSALLIMGGLATAMTALSADRNTISKEGQLQSYPAGVDIFYKGAMVCINAAGFVVPAADTAGYSSVIGVADEQVDNSSGSAGDLNVRVRTNRRYLFVATGTLVQGNVGETMYVVDDQTFNADQQVNAIVAGVLTEFVSTTAGYVSIEMPAGSSGAGVTTTELTLQGRNEGTAFEAGDICVVDHYDETEDRMVLVLADADTIGLAAVHLWVTRVALANNTNGTFHKTYRETGQNTNASTEGDAVFLSATPGDWTETSARNADPNGVAVSVGRVAVVSASIGEVEINLEVGGLEQIGTNEYQDTSITADKVDLSSLVTLAHVAHDDSSPVTLLASASQTRTVAGIIAFTEDCSGTPDFDIGETDTTDKFHADFGAGVALQGESYLFVGTLTAAKALLCTIADAGTAGEFDITIIIGN